MLKNKVKEREVSEGSSSKKYDVMKEESMVYSMDRASAVKEVSLEG